MVQPLTKRDKSGVLYQRPAVVEAQVAGVLGLERQALSARLRVSDRKSSDYLVSECLVHLIRQAMRDNDHPVTHLADAIRFDLHETLQSKRATPTLVDGRASGGGDTVDFLASDTAATKAAFLLFRGPDEGGWSATRRTHAACERVLRKRECAEQAGPMSECRSFNHQRRITAEVSILKFERVAAYSI